MMFSGSQSRQMRSRPANLIPRSFYATQEFPRAIVCFKSIACFASEYVSKFKERFVPKLRRRGATLRHTKIAAAWLKALENVTIPTPRRVLALKSLPL